jgi:hypothetical protein
MVTAVRNTIASALDLFNSLFLSAAPVQQALGALVSTLVDEVLGDSVVQTALAAYLTSETDAELAAGVVSLLQDALVRATLADELSSAISDFLNYPGFNAALIGALNSAADAVLSGTPVSQALSEALSAFQRSAAFDAAVDAIIPEIVSSLFGTAGITQAFGAAARLIVDDFVTSFGITNPFVLGVVGQLANGTLESLLTQAGAKDLLDELAIGLLTGKIPMGWSAGIEPFLIQAVLNQPNVQGAFGIALGQGIGSLFGDNLFGDVVGFAAGVAATITISVLASLARVFEQLAAAVSPAAALAKPAASSGAGGSDYFFQHAAAGDLDAVAVLVRTEHEANALHRAATSGGLALTEMTFTGPADEESNYLDINMTIDASSASGSGAEQAPMFVAFRFNIDQLFPVAEFTRSVSLPIPASVPTS